MAAPPDVDFLIGELLSDEGHATGAHAFSRKVTVGEALAVATRVHEEVDAGTAARAEAAEAEGVHLACRRGCSACCAEPIMVFLPEALAVAGWLLRPEGAAARATFLAAYPAWRAQVGDSLAVLGPLDGRVDYDARVAVHLAHQRRHILCPFLEDGACGVYGVRPTVCRTAHAVDTADYCGADHPSGKAATRLAFVPLDDFLRRVRRLDHALHRALGARPDGLGPLPDLVHALVARAGAGQAR